jgi:hypothetical protein
MLDLEPRLRTSQKFEPKLMISLAEPSRVSSRAGALVFKLISFFIHFIVHYKFEIEVL